LFYHLVWSTRNREPLLTSNIEPIIYDFLRAKAIGLEAKIFALNGIEDHIHMVVSIPPKIVVAKFVGQVKAVSSVKYNQMPGIGSCFYWQEEYGAFSFDAKRLPNYVQYVECQKEHHTQQTTIPILERMNGEGVVRIRDPLGLYVIEDDVWRKELMSQPSPPGDGSPGY
jgi:putative transposase